MDDLRLSPAYRWPVWSAVVQQVPVAFFFLLLLDGGGLARLAACVMAGFWCGVLTIVLRRPQNPTPDDLQFIRIGYAPLLAVGLGLAAAIGRAVG